MDVIAETADKAKDAIADVVQNTKAAFEKVKAGFENALGGNQQMPLPGPENADVFYDKATKGIPGDTYHNDSHDNDIIDNGEEVTALADALYEAGIGEGGVGHELYDVFEHNKGIITQDQLKSFLESRDLLTGEELAIAQDKIRKNMPGLVAAFNESLMFLKAEDGEHSGDPEGKEISAIPALELNDDGTLKNLDDVMAAYAKADAKVMEQDPEIEYYQDENGELLYEEDIGTTLSLNYTDDAVTDTRFASLRVFDAILRGNPSGIAYLNEEKKDSWNSDDTWINGPADEVKFMVDWIGDSIDEGKSMVERDDRMDY
jgi:hypothetical protein